MIQAILVLGHLMESCGRLSVQSLSRCIRAAELAKEQEPSFVFSSGAAYRTDSKLALGDVVQTKLKALIDLNPKQFIADTKSRDTVGDAFFSKSSLALPNRVGRLLVVTSLFHAPRSEEIFKFVYGDDLEVEVFADQDMGTYEQREHELKSLEEFRNSFSRVRPGDYSGIKAVLMVNHLLYPKI